MKRYKVVDRDRAARRRTALKAARAAKLTKRIVSRLTGIAMRYQ